MPKTYQIPFVKYPSGEIHMLEYIGWNMAGMEMRDNIIFQADLQLLSHYRGRSAARVRVKNLSNGEIYSLGFGAFYDAANTLKISKGKITGGTWTFRKQGSNYGLVPVEPPKKPRKKAKKPEISEPEISEGGTFHPDDPWHYK